MYVRVLHGRCPEDRDALHATGRTRLASTIVPLATSEDLKMGLEAQTAKRAIAVQMWVDTQASSQLKLVHF